ncbi:MAG: S1C family serine protease, partial [Bacteroidales bacterium]|nr:S1C family serine protease [Bacteroidales bacterium]
MKKVTSISCTFIFLVVVYSTGLSQTSRLLENLQSEISELINIVKYSIVTISSQSTHNYVVEKNDGITSIFGSNLEEKKDDLWIIGSGIIYNADGYIITKSSLLTDFEKIKVTL